ncbi:hypothetical protein FQA39_LY12236 [Lamprigera yunnana]|nr:hypothetical protein FQA39_LY12236 [Lamprigera yunnana]
MMSKKPEFYFSSIYLAGVMGTILCSQDWTFKLYRNDLCSGTENLNLSDPSFRTVFIVHGWNQNGSQPCVLEMKDAFLAEGQANVIVVNWAPESFSTLYVSSAAAVPAVGDEVGNTIFNLYSNGKINITSTKMVGFSLGGHVSAVAGQKFEELSGKKLEQIVGLEAPGVGFSDKNKGLDENDAKFVLGYHTSRIGRTRRYGHVDVYFNADPFHCHPIRQPDCPRNPGVEVPKNTFTPYIFCSHLRSVAYFIESIRSGNFIAKECVCGAAEYCFDHVISVGDGMDPSSRGQYYLTTNANSPFARGLNGT